MGTGVGALPCVSSFCCAVKQTTLGVLLGSRDCASPGRVTHVRGKKQAGCWRKKFLMTTDLRESSAVSQAGRAVPWQGTVISDCRALSRAACCSCSHCRTGESPVNLGVRPAKVKRVGRDAASSSYAFSLRLEARPFCPFRTCSLTLFLCVCGPT